MTRDDIDDWALHAYVDNELSSEQRAEVEVLLARDPAAARRVADWRRQREILKTAYGGVLTEHVPQHVAAALRGRPVSRLRALAAIAATIMLLLLGGLTGWFLKSEMPIAASVSAEALAAHRLYAVDAAHAMDVSAADKPALQSWLTRRVGFPFKLPDLSTEGYNLLGGRLLPGENGATALLMYEAASGQRLSVLLAVTPIDRNSALKIGFNGELTVCSWQDGKLAVAVAGEIAKDTMMKLSTSIYEQLEG
jgi:anti-sigma factor RsiW